MVINIKHIGGTFAFLILLQMVLVNYFGGEIQDKSQALQKKSKIISSLSELESKWSKKAQKQELEKIYKLLNVFDVEYTLKEKKKRKILTMDLKQKNADKVLALLVNRSVNVKKMSVEKVDKYTLKLIVEIL